MALSINHNMAAMNAQRNLLNTNEELNKSMQRLSSGFRINQGSDDPAGLVISEQFRAQIAGLNSAIGNSEGSISMVQTAEGAITEINNLLISMRELAIHAANEGFNDSDQLAADQAEIANAITTIDRIAANTQFGTKKLLDGSKENIATITSAGTSGLDVNASYLSTGTHSVTATKTADPSATLNTDSLGLSLANNDGDPYNLSEAVHNVDVIQASDVASRTTDSIDLTDAFGNNLELAAAGSAATLASAAVVGTAVAANVGDYTFSFNYQENGESPTGNQEVTIAVAIGDTTSSIATKLNTAINLNADLQGKITASGADGAALDITATNQGAQYSVSTEASTTTATTSLLSFTAGSDRGASVNVLNMTANTAANASVTSAVTIGAATYSDMSTLTAAFNTALDTAFGDVDAVAGTQDVFAEVTNTNQINIHTRDEGSSYSLQINELNSNTNNARNVLGLSTFDSSANTGVDALVSFNNYTNTIDDVKYGTAGEVTLKNKADDDITQGTVLMTTQTAQSGGIEIGNLLLNAKAAKFDVRLDGGPASSVTAGVDTVIFNADRSESMNIAYGLTSQGGTETINNTDQSLVFQIGANVGQTAKIGLRNMSASSLGNGLSDNGNLFRSLADIDVTSVQGAQDAQSIIDAAINEVSTTRGTLGSFQKNTLESNLRNLRIAAQNLTASEAQIRDTDMASEMSNFTKYQILSQAGTSMLAQANQVPQSILSLFR